MLADSDDLRCETVHLLDTAVCPGGHSTSSCCVAKSALTSKSVWSRVAALERLGVQCNQ